MAWAYTKSVAVSGRTAATTAGSAVIVISVNTSLVLGHLCEGAGIPASSVVVGISGTNITLSQAATATATGVAVTFYHDNLTQSGTDTSWAGIATATNIPADLVTVLAGVPNIYQVNRGRIVMGGIFSAKAREGRLLIRASAYGENTINLTATADVTLDGRASFGSPASAALGLVAIESYIVGSGGFSRNLLTGVAGSKLNLTNCAIFGSQTISLTNIAVTFSGLVSFVNPTIGNNGSGAPFSYNATTSTFDATTVVRMAGGWRVNPSRTGSTADYLAAGKWEFEGIGATQAVPRLIYESTDWVNSSGSGIALRDAAQLIVRNAPAGSALSVGAFAVGTVANNKGIAIPTRYVSHTAALSTGAALAGAVVYTKDILDGNQGNPTDYITGSVGGTEYDGTARKTYIWSADASGVAVAQDVVLAYSYLPTPDSTTLKRNVRTLNAGAGSDQLNFAMLHYAALPQYTPIKLRASGALVQGWQALADADAVLTEADARAKLDSAFAIDPVAMTVTVTANSTFDDVYCISKAYKCTATAVNVETPDPADPRKLIVMTIGNALTGYAGWTLIVNAGVTVSAGTKFYSLYFPTITLAPAVTTGGVTTPAGAITGLYSSDVGASSIIEITATAGSSIYAGSAAGVTQLFAENIVAGTSRLYIAPGDNAPVSVVRELYGYQRKEDTITPTGGLYSFTPLDIPDVGITEANAATVLAYTTLENTSKLYDYLCAFRLTEQGIKLSGIVQRAGTQLQFGVYSGVVKSTSLSVLTVSGSTITLKAASLSSSSKYDTIVATPPAVWVGDTVEEINCEVEDANGDSSVNIEASGVSTFEIWKITDATPEDDYATGTLLATAGIGKYRFIHADGFKMVIRDTTTNFRVVSPMEKGTYIAALFFGASVQLAQAAEVSEINNKVDIVQLDIDAIKGTGFVKDRDSLVNIKKKIKFAVNLLFLKL